MNKVAIYLRLSDEDQDKLNNDELSESIKNQETILRNYANSQNWIVTKVYNDEDYSGADRDRPNFNKMIEACKNKEVNIVLCKTQSRFARDMELIEKYIYNKFIEWNIRFITVIDKIDNTKQETKKMSQILGLTDEWYLEDTSKNIRETLKAKRLKGEFTGAFAPYGYKKDPENKNHLIPDPPAAHIIQRIYHEYSQGYSLNKIVTHLTQNNILSPLEYKLMNGSKIKIPTTNKYYTSIYKNGTYIIKISLKNNENYIIKNLTTLELLTDNTDFCNKFKIKLINVKNEKIKLYYTTKKYNKVKFDDLHINNNDWIPIKINTILPKNTKYIATYIPKLDRTNEIFYEFEVTLKENENYNIYNYIVYSNKKLTNKHNVKIRNKYAWNEQTIKKFLKDEVYIGNLVQFKTTTLNYKNHKTIYNSKNKFIKTENTHEPLISKYTWNKVQERLQKKSKSCKNGKVNILANKIYCKNCNKPYTKCGKNNSKGMSYLCCSEKKNKWINCNNKKYINEELLHKIILDRFNTLIKKYYQVEQIKQIHFQCSNNNPIKKNIINLFEELKNLNKILNQKNNFLMEIYEDKKSGIITAKEFIVLKNKYNNDIIKINKRIESIEKEINNLNKKNEKYQNINTFLKKKIIIKELNIDIVNNFIMKIYIENFDIKNKKQNIHIIWNI